MAWPAGRSHVPEAKGERWDSASGAGDERSNKMRPDSEEQDMKGTASEKVGVAVTTATEQKMDGQMKMFSHTLKVVTDGRVELYNLTDRVRDLVRDSGIKAGFLSVTIFVEEVVVVISSFFPVKTGIGDSEEALVLEYLIFINPAIRPLSKISKVHTRRSFAGNGCKIFPV